MTTQQSKDNEYLTRGSSSRRGESLQSRGSQLLRRDTLDAALEGPFTIKNRLFQDMDQLLYGLWPAPSGREPIRSQEWRPPVDVFEQDGKLIVQADVPGMHKENLNVEVRDDRLFISGERRSSSEQQRGGYRQTERTYGKFTRAIPLPQWVRPEEMVAKFEDGVLQVEIPMVRRHIEIQ